MDDYFKEEDTKFVAMRQIISKLRKSGFARRNLYGIEQVWH